MLVHGIIASTLAVLVITPSWSQTQADFDLPALSNERGPKLELWSTRYFVHVAASSPLGITLKDKHGNVLSDPVSPRDWCLAAIEGTVRVALKDDARTLNYGGVSAQSQVDCAAVLKINPVKHPWIKSTGKSFFGLAMGSFGDGVAGYKLVPYRTIAVDKSVIPYGTVIYIPSARGSEVSLSSSGKFKHDGYFFAADTGGAIKGNHIDIFCGVTSSNCLPDLITSDSTKRFKAFLVSDSAVVEALRARHK